MLPVLVPVLLLFGAVLHHFWIRRKTQKRRKIPKRWPLSARSITNSEEARVWHWLTRAFYDHHVMIKLPVTRFTMPEDQTQGMEWHDLLGAVYCTFTICKPDGRVVGCLDVPGRSATPRSTRMLKHSLLTQYELPYWVVRSSSLPTVSEIRREFLGETPTPQTMREREMEERALIDAQVNLRSALKQLRGSRTNEFNPLLASDWSDNDPGDGPTSDLGSQWQDNSFLIPFDSRKGPLT